MDEEESDSDVSSEESRKKINGMQKKRMEAQVNAFEGQKKLRKTQMEMSLRQLDAGRKITEKTIDRMKADRDVIEKVEFTEEKNEVKKRALKTKMAEMDAIMEGEKLKLEVIKFNRENIEKQLEQLDKMQPGNVAQRGFPGQKM